MASFITYPITGDTRFTRCGPETKEAELSDDMKFGCLLVTMGRGKFTCILIGALVSRTRAYMMDITRTALE
jgi:hypothetical protein